MAGVDLVSVKKKAGGALRGFTRGQIAMLVIAVVATVAGIMVFMSWASTTQYALLYSGLSAKDAAAVTQELTSRNIPYELAAGGTAVMVPQEQVYQLRIDLSAKGVPTGGASGWEILDQQGLTTSDFRQRVDYQRALEGELAKTIGSIQGVQAATVHLVIPKADIFTSDDRKPSASVLVATVSGVTLGNQQVKSIVNLVASSVEGLTPQQVTLADAKGRILAAPGQDATGATDDHGDQTRTYEATLAKQITSMLESVTGPGKARVTVNALLDFDKRQTTTERFPPDPQQAQAPVVKETTSSEDYQGTGTVVGGVLGPTIQTGQQGAGGETKYTKTAGDKTYAVGKVTETFQTAPGTVKKLSVAVLVDESAGVDTARVESLVRAASGYDQARGDVVQVETLPFDQTVADQNAKALDEATKAAEPAAGAGTDSMITTGATVLVIVLVLLRAWRGARHPKRRKGGDAKLPATLTDGGGGGRALPSADGAGQLEPSERIVIPQLGGPVPSQETMQINDLIERQPEDVAKMLRTWMADRRN